ncbi:MAG: MerR family transcriptional regulator [Cyanobacteriota bacterium]
MGRSPETSFRYFNQNTVNVLKKIRILRKENKSIHQIKEILKTK